jgi:hypothetical protein
MRHHLKLAFAAAALAATVLGGAAQAAVFTWTFRGVVGYGNDDTGVFGAPSDDLTGRRWRAVVTTDTGTPDAVIEDGGVYTRIDGYGDLTPVKVAFTLNGVTRLLGVPPASQGEFGNADGRQLQLDGVVDGFPYDEAFDIQADNTAIWGTAGINVFLRERIELLGVGAGLDFLPGPDFTTLPSLLPPPGATFAGYVSFDHVEGNGQPGGETVYERAVAGLRITSITAGAVPEPASWAMMILGFGAIGALARRRRDAAQSFG